MTRKNQRGSVMLMAAITLALMLVMALGLLTLSNGTFLLGRRQPRLGALRSLADAGLQYGYWRTHYNGAGLTWTENWHALGPGGFAVAVSDYSATVAGSFKVSSTGAINNDTFTETRVYDAPGSPGPYLAFARYNPNFPVSLTGEGTADWGQWGYTSVATFDHKSLDGGVTAVGLISNYTRIGAGTVTRFYASPSSFLWSDGKPYTSATTSYAFYIQGVGSGFSITVPANTAGNTLKFYVGIHGLATAQMQATLSDGSAAAVTGTVVSAVTGRTLIQYTIWFAAGSNGQSLTVTWKETAIKSGTPDVDLIAATLK